jgi:hypothetical protein
MRRGKAKLDVEITTTARPSYSGHGVLQNKDTHTNTGM